jgi:hypothetical protein
VAILTSGLTASIGLEQVSMSLDSWAENESVGGN